MKLLIVESPTKAKTIKKFLPKEYTVASSFGHLRDLPKSKMGIDIEHDFAPQYIIARDKTKRANELKTLAKKADVIILASDEDREGEAIAWHLKHILEEDKKPKNKNTKTSPSKKAKNFQRIVFHEITKTAITKALEHPREIDTHLVDAQQARRVLDRLTGYELSPFLWKKIRRGLSAGRVQSVALRFIVEREKERNQFKESTSFSLRALLKKSNEENTFEAKLTQQNNEKIEKTQNIPIFAGTYRVSSSTIEKVQDADAIAEDLKNASCTITSVEKKETKRTPPPPFTTSTLQQAAINRFGFSSKQTMRLAQKLYENGLITYMRTDSVSLSLESTLSAKKIIEKQFGTRYSLESPRHYKNKTKGAQEAHEAIRPTYPDKAPEDFLTSLDTREAKLYQLIWNRMIASQMAPAILDAVKITILAKGKNAEYTLTAHGSSIRFDGFFVVAGKPEETLLPDLSKGDSLFVDDIIIDEKQTSPPPRYTEASLIKILEEREIGRPSTYAPTISTLFDRGYVDRDENRRLFPQEIGTVVCDLLTEHFTQIVDIDFTANLEKTLDDIATGNAQWVPIVRDFYEPFHKNLEKKTQEIKKEDLVESVGRNCPECDKELIVKYGRFGKFIACLGYPECSYTERSEEDKQLEAKHQKKCPKCGEDMIVKRGRFGPFLGCSRYPECKTIEKIENKTGITCPNCGKGEIVERKSKRGKVFYGCNQFPKCKTAFWNKPTGENCSACNAPLVMGTKGNVLCSNKECPRSKTKNKKS